MNHFPVDFQPNWIPIGSKSFLLAPNLSVHGEYNLIEVDLAGIGSVFGSVREGLIAEYKLCWQKFDLAELPFQILRLNYSPGF